MTHAKERRGWLGSCPLHRKPDNKSTKAAVRTTQKLPGRIFTQLAKIMFCDKNLQNRPQLEGVQRRPGRRSPSFCDRDPFLRSYNLTFLRRHLDWNQCLSPPGMEAGRSWCRLASSRSHVRPGPSAAITGWDVAYIIQM